MPDASGRVILPELLDRAEPGRAIASLNDLTRINRYLGGHRTLRWMLRKLLQSQESFSFLDVGAASGDMGDKVRRWYPRAVVVSLDRLSNHLARAAPPKVIGDAFRLPFAPRSFDFAFSSLFLHHFDDAAVAELLRGFGLVARRAVLAIDLERGALGRRFVPATRWLFGWDPITLHDAPVSVSAAFSAAEFESLARRAGFKNPGVRVHRPWSRLSLIAPV